MAKLEKFLFDTEFEVGARAAEATKPEAAPDPATLPIYSENDLRDARNGAREDGYAEGHRAGLDEARAEIAAFAAQALDRAAAHLQQLADAEAANVEAARHDAAELALALARALAGALVAREPAAEIEAMIQETLAQLSERLRDSRIVVRVAPSLVGALEEHMTAITARVGFAGEVMVLADDALGAGDCRIEWADGGAERDTALIDRLVGEAVARYVAPAIAIEAPADDPAAAEPADVTPPPLADETPADSGVKEVGGSKSVRYD